MAGFHTHITVSTAVGVGYGLYGATHYGMPLETCALAGGLCAVAGVMPDLDSDTGVPARETMSFAAAIVPMLLFGKFETYGMSVEQMMLAGAPLYLLIRFGLASILGSVSVHRGMFHSIPAAVIAGLLAYLLCDSGVHLARYYKAIAVSVGYLTHLVLDEMWSFDLSNGMPRVKRSLGTALKLFGENPGANLSTYTILALLFLTASNDLPTPTQQMRINQRLHQAAVRNGISITAATKWLPPGFVIPSPTRYPAPDVNDPVRLIPTERQPRISQLRGNESHNGSSKFDAQRERRLPVDEWQPRHDRPMTTPFDFDDSPRGTRQARPMPSTRDPRLGLRESSLEDDPWRSDRSSEPNRGGTRLGDVTPRRDTAWRNDDFQFDERPPTNAPRASSRSLTTVPRNEPPSRNRSSQRDVFDLPKQSETDEDRMFFDRPTRTGSRRNTSPF